ncbi:hypothetical protein ACFFX0_10085 [Citricoccus parietis]|uniref:Uncharacterized protein n=1 Tax=Citricoccus parietis TaxID=592307 RepID=A0ABV5FXW9_9MICC
MPLGQAAGCGDEAHGTTRGAARGCRDVPETEGFLLTIREPDGMLCAGARVVHAVDGDLLAL